MGSHRCDPIDAESGMTPEHMHTRAANEEHFPREANDEQHFPISDEVLLSRASIAIYSIGIAAVLVAITVELL